MAIPVNYSEPAHNHLPGTNWQRLGQLKLGAGSSPNGTITAWLEGALRNLSLPKDLVNRLLASIEEATAGILNPDIGGQQFDFLEIVMLAPSWQTSQGHTWGFFRVERTSIEPLDERTKGHCIEYYLYLDKKTGK